jgi:hypothetical protein
MYDVALLEPAVECERLFAVDENPHVWPDSVLLVDHAEANSRISPVEITEHVGERAAEGLHFLAVGVREQRAWNEHFHAQMLAASSA